MTEPGKTSFENLDESSSPEGDELEGAGASSSTVARNTLGPRTSAQVSLFIEALVRTLSSTYETDPQRVTQIYTKICENLFRMGLIDESWKMTELEGARVQFQHALLQLFGESPVRAPSSLLLHYTSQYQREFEECEKIGQGAFGKVFRVKHKLDGREYAVKKIPIHSSKIASIKKYLAEVKTFASLNHINIVQYRAAWFEVGMPLDFREFSTPRLGESRLPVPVQSDAEQSSFQIDTSSSSLSDRLLESGDHSNLPKPIETEPFLSHRERTNNSHLVTIKTDNESDFEIVFAHSSRGSRAKGSRPSSSKSLPTERALVPVHRNGGGVQQNPKVRWATLYIQMALCHGTLDQWLRRRNESFNSEVAIVPSGAQMLRTKAIQQILIQILRGLEYIHSKGVVHHDIKPSNIFVSAGEGSLLVQLGDFGLACPLRRSRHDFARGTRLYAAPEQLAGRCDPKSDMYSVGIVLFELLKDFNTDMERTSEITKLRGKSDPLVPPDLSLDNLVSALVRRRSSQRPDASTLLRALEEEATPDVDSLRKLIEEKDIEINRLTELLRKHGIRLEDNN